MSTLLTLYLAGVIVGLWRGQSRPAPRLALALLWPIGPLAGVVVVAGLLVVAAIAFPPVGLGVALGAAALWWLNG